MIKQLKIDRLYTNLSMLSTYRSELMGISACAILICHSVGRGVAWPLGLGMVFIYGNFGVDMFLFLSGIGMFFSLQKDILSVRNNAFCIDWRKIGGWYCTRYKRILVPYLLVAIPYYIYYCYLSGESIFDCICYITAISFWTKHNGIWYIAMLIPLYFITPFMAYVIECAKHRWIPTTILILFCILISVYNISGVSAPLFSVLNNCQIVLSRVPAYIFGYFAGKYIKNGYSINWLNLLLAVIPLIWVIKKYIPYDICVSFLIIIPLLCLSYFIIHRVGIIRKCCLFMGNISLESYLLNVTLPIILFKVKYQIGGVDLNYGNFLAYGLVIVIGIMLSIIVHKLSLFILGKYKRSN